MIINTKRGVKGVLKRLEVVNGTTGKVVRRINVKQKNLILDNGLNYLMSDLYATDYGNGGTISTEFWHCVAKCHAGTGSSGPTDVTKTTLDNKVDEANAYGVVVTSNPSTGELTATLRYDMPIRVTNEVYAELGWTTDKNNTRGLVSRKVLPSTITVNAGFLLRVIYEFTLQVGPVTPQSFSELLDDGEGNTFDLEGDLVLQGVFGTDTRGLGFDNKNVCFTGYTIDARQGHFVYNSGRTANIRFLTASFSFNSFGSADPSIASTTVPIAGSIQSYTNGNFYRDIIYTVPANQFNTTAYGVRLRHLWLKFDNPQLKSDLSEIVITTRDTITRL